MARQAHESRTTNVFKNSLEAMVRQLSEAILPDFPSSQNNGHSSAYEDLSQYLRTIDAQISQSAANNQAFNLLFEDGSDVNPCPWALVFRRLCYSILEPLSSSVPAACYLYEGAQLKWASIMDSPSKNRQSRITSP